MLVLSRKVGEKVIITVPPSTQPTVIAVTLVETRADRCRLGYEAPRTVSIHRQEIHDAMKREQADGSS
jgi:carbon storage regulator